MYSTIFCHQTFYASELFEKFEEVRCGRVWKQHKHGIGELRHVFYAWINTGSGQKGSVIVARMNTGLGQNRLRDRLLNNVTKKYAKLSVSLCIRTYSINGICGDVYDRLDYETHATDTTLHYL